MSGALSILKWFDAPGSTPVLVLCIAIGVLLAFVWPKRKRLARVWLGGVFGVYLSLALPWVAAGISGRLPAIASPRFVAGHPVETLVVLDGDNRFGRVREAKRIYDLAGPKAVWSLGYEPWLEEALPASGIPRDRVKHDLGPKTTREQIAWVRQLTDKQNAASIVIVASRLQMPRVSALLSAAGVQALAAPAPADTEPPTTGVRLFVPSYVALRISRDALYEHIALFYYRLKRWI